MVERRDSVSSHWWWLDNQYQSPRRSTWLQSTLAELDEKTKAILKLIELDADSFAQRAEMYYKKRPELISMVEDFYRSHRSLAERYDRIKNESGARRLVLAPWSALRFPKYCQLEKSASSVDKSYDSYSETYDPADSGESEIDDPEEEVAAKAEKEAQEEEVSSVVCNVEVMKLKADKEVQEEEVSNDEVMKLREEIERLSEENRVQKDQLVQKDEEKREVIRQLSLAMDAVKEENGRLRKIVNDLYSRHSNFEFRNLRDSLLGKLFNVPAKSQASVVAL